MEPAGRVLQLRGGRPTERWARGRRQSAREVVSGGRRGGGVGLVGAVELEPQSEPIDLALHGLLHCVRGLLRRAPWVGLGLGVRDQGLGLG